jgi:uncharacterized lipoprotein YajG
MLKKILFILASLSSLAGCRTSTDYPYNPNSVVYYEAEPVEETLVIIPVRPYYRFDHQNQDYYHSTPMKR